MSSLKDKLNAAYQGSDNDKSDYKKYNKTGNPDFIEEPDELSKEFEEKTKQPDKPIVPPIQETTSTRGIPPIETGNSSYAQNNTYSPNNTFSGGFGGSQYGSTSSYGAQSSYGANTTTSSSYTPPSYGASSPQSPVDKWNEQNRGNNMKSSSASSYSSGSVTPEIIGKAISLYEDIRRLSNTQKSMMFNILQVQEQEMDRAIYETINGDRSSVNAISSLIELYKQVPVDRAFSLMGMDNRDLKDIESLTISILNKGNIEIDVDREKINYCRTLVEEIEKLSSDTMKDLEPISKILEKGLE